MRIPVALLISGIAILASACSDTAIRRTGYETLQNIREQECSRTPSVECERRESMEVYKNRREEVERAD